MRYNSHVIFSSSWTKAQQAQAYNPHWDIGYLSEKLVHNQNTRHASIKKSNSVFQKQYNFGRMAKIAR